MTTDGNNTADPLTHTHINTRSLLFDRIVSYRFAWFRSLSHTVASWSFSWFSATTRFSVVAARVVLGAKRLCRRVCTPPGDGVLEGVCSTVVALT